MRVGLGVDQLDAGPDSVARPPDAPLQHIAYAQLAADLLRVSRPVPIGECGIARDHQHIREPRQIGRQVFGDPVGKILLFAVVAQIDEGQDHDRQAWRSGRGGGNLPLYTALGAGAHVSGELIASTSDRANQVAVRQGRAERPDLAAQIALFDDPARPGATD